MRKLYVILCLLLATFVVKAQTVSIGTGTVTSGQSPFDSYFGYSYVQTLYLGSEINGSGSITSIRYYFAGTSLANSQAIKIYMGTVARSSFASATDWEPLANLSLVFDGNIGAVSAPGWITITLSTPYAYNSTSGNLLIAVDENTNNFDGITRFRGTTIGTNRVLYFASDATNPNPTTPPSGTRNSVVGNIEIEGLTLGCQLPTTIASNSITTSSVNFTWNAPAAGPAVSGYAYEVRTSGAPGSGATGLVSSGSSATPSVAVNSLSPATTYSFYVRSDCGGGNLSGWSAVTSFTTLCVPFATPTMAAETFATYLPSTCWSEASGLLTSATTFTSTTSSFWGQDDFGNVLSPVNKAASLNIYTTNRREWLISPSFNLGATGNKQLEFDLALTTFANTTANTLGADDKFAVVISTDDGLTWSDANILRSWSSSTPISNTGEHIVIDLSAYTGTVKFGFYGESTVSNADNDIFVDNFAINVIPVCAGPTGIVANTITNTSAGIEWIPPATAPASYDVYLSTSNTAPTGSTTPTATGVSTPYAATSLSANTTYYVWVRGNCGGSLVSEWPTLAASFTTECNPATTITQNFDGVTTPALPSCWKKIIRGSAAANATITTTTGNANTTPNSASLYNSGAGASDDVILVSPVLSNVGAGTHQLKFWAKNSSAANDIEIGTVDYSSGTAVFNVLQTVDVTTTYQQFIISFAGFTGTTGQHIGFRRLNATTFSYVYIDDVVWEVIPACSEPTAINISNLTTTGADVNWTPPAIAPASYDVYYSTSNTAPTAATTPSATGINNPYSITGLNPSTLYYVWVRGNCGGADRSTWSLAVSFTTVCAPFATPTTSAETFATYLPSTCWSEASGLLAASTTFTSTTSSLWGQDDFGNVASPVNRAAGLNIYTTNRREWLISPEYDLGTAANKQLEFDLALTAFASTNSATLGSDDKFVVLISPDGGLTWSDANALRTWNSTTPISNTGEHIIIDLSGYTGVVKFAFYGESTVSNADNDIFVDNFAINVIPNCSSPSSASVGSLTVNSASVSWTPPATAPASYDLYYSTTNTAPTSSTTPSATGVTTPYVLSGLTSNTTYYVWLRGNCGTGNIGAWMALPATFTTLCTALNIPYTQNFDAVVAPNLAPCTAVENVNADGSTWRTLAAPTGYTGSVMYYSWNFTNPGDDWFYTAGLNLVAGKSYILSYKYGNNSTTYVEKMKIAIGSSTLASAMTTVLADYSSINDNMPRAHAIRFTAPTTGVYYIGFQAYSDADQDRLYLDDISVTEANVAPTTLNSCVTVTAPAIDAQNNTKWMSLVDAAGNIVGEINGNGNSLGAVSVKVYRHSGAVRQDLAGRYYMNRNIEITPTSQPTTPVSVRLYFSAAEFAALQGQTGANVSTFTDISVFKNTDACGSQVMAVANKLSTVTTQYEGSYVANFDVSNFSSFYFAASTYSVLPANILSFSGVRKAGVNQLKWSVAQEQNVLEYEVERSEDGGRNWMKAGAVPSIGNTSDIRKYSFNDAGFAGLQQLYRLRQVDRNGVAKLSNIVNISGSKTTVLTVTGLFPNPASTTVSVLVDAPAKDNLTLLVMDAVGRVVKSQKVGVEAGSNTVSLSVVGLTQGSYLLKVTYESKCETAVSKFIKE